MRQLSDIICNPKPLTLPPSATVRAACTQMRDHCVGSVLVINSRGRLVGIFTGRDAVHRVLAAGKSAARTKIGDVMTAKPVTMPPDTSAIEALRLMWNGGFRHVPVVEDGKIVGVVSRGDFAGYEQDRLDEERNLWDHIR